MNVVIYKIVKARCALLFTSVDAKQYVVGIVIVFVCIMAIIGCDDRHIVLLGKLQQCAVDDFLLLYIMAL